MRPLYRRDWPAFRLGSVVNLGLPGTFPMPGVACFPPPLVRGFAWSIPHAGGCLGSPPLARGEKLVSGHIRPIPVIGDVLRQAQDERLARMAGGCPAAGGGYGRMGGVLLGIGITGAIPDWLCYDSNDSRTSITHRLRAVNNLGEFWDFS